MAGGHFDRAAMVGAAALAMLWVGSSAARVTTGTAAACQQATAALAGAQIHVDVLAAEHRAIHARYELGIVKMEEARDAFLKAAGINLDDLDTSAAAASKTAAPAELDRYLLTVRLVNDDLHSLRMVTGLLAPALEELDRLRAQAAASCGDAPDAPTRSGMLPDARVRGRDLEPSAGEGDSILDRRQEPATRD